MDSSSLDPYSKVVALTQGMINNGFRALPTMYSALEHLRYPEPEKKWDIALSFLPPRISIHDNGTVYLQISISSGTIQLSTGSSVSLQGWSLYHKIDHTHLLTPRSSVLKALEASAVLGDLSLERFLAILLATPHEGLVPDAELSECSEFDGDRTVKIKWRDWCAKNAETAIKLQDVFLQWPQSLAKLGYNFMGLRFLLPQAETSSVAASDVTETANEERCILLHKAATSGETQDSSSGGDNNSILICHTAGTRDPALHFDAVGFCRNFLADALSSPGSDVLSGFWTTNSYNILEKVILPHLRIINKASEIKVSDVVWSTLEDGTQTYTPVYTISQDFATAQIDSSWEETSPTAFDFIEHPGSGPWIKRIPKWYSWSSVSGPSTINFELADKSLDRKSQVTTSAEHSTTVTFNPPKNIVFVECSTVYKFKSKWTTVSTNDSPGSCSFEYHQTWKMEISLSLRDGGFGVKVTSYPRAGDSNVNFSARVLGMSLLGEFEPYELRHAKTLEKFALQTFRPSVLAACGLFKQNIERSLHWPAAENRWIDFQKAVLNFAGDLVVGIHYKSPVRQDLLEIADLSLSRPRPPVRPEEPVKPEEPPTPTKALKLQWTCTATFPAQGKLSVSVHATNSTGGDVALGGGLVELVFESSRKDGALFSALHFPKPGEVLAVSEPVGARVVGITRDAARPGIFRAIVSWNGGLADGTSVSFVLTCASKAVSGVEFVLAARESFRDASDESVSVDGEGVVRVVVS
ncbi:hypothetical protein F4678DRAFT_482798 [Xylaria arbuscula]|nr:hypothetical protein F4678DRAFT_482798 [Xylaria arbuscula]